MKTQISNLFSGTKNQILNPNTDYTQRPKATSHIGHSGSNMAEVAQVWEKVTAENPEFMTIRVMGMELTLKANWSLSGKSVSYHTSISAETLSEKFGLVPSKKGTPWISIQNANIITVDNGKNSQAYICPSYIEIL